MATATAASSAALMASSQPLYLPITKTHSNRLSLRSRTITFTNFALTRPQISLSFSLPRNPKPLLIRATKRTTLAPIAAPLTTPPPTFQAPTESPLAGSTRTLTTLCALVFAVARKFSFSILNLNSSLSHSLAPAAGSLFFAALRDRPSGYLNTPLTVVAAGLSKWLDIYSGVLMVRVLLSWFPNIPWDRQPLSAIRDLCDPYLNLFRNIIPPVFDTLDVSPLLAFAVLGTLGSILSSSTGI
ncbi:ylmG homolog protein 1-2, chloroplastic-like [Humulus lupulus]|uniref:ylmG homolog protein 1-2, chloroplastic-like n=1 Tax=Humulus lupulus TaxID=3486 RepID=UPI002B407C72|nr:ylmG homolog protein 1-2, chloroplastic-like [Humulus lupulus]